MDGAAGAGFCLGMPILVVGFIVLVWALSCIQVLNEYERGVIFRLGRIPGGKLGRPKGPGLIFVFRPLDRIVKVSTRTVVMDVPPQDVITKDNISIKVNAVVYFQVVDAIAAVVKVENFLYATSQLAQTTLRAVLGQVELDELLGQRDKINAHLQDILDKHSEPWGVKVTLVEVKQIDLPPDMQRTMAMQAEAERERRAKITAAEGEFQAAQKIADAAKIIASEPASLQLRYLQTLVEISAEKTSTIIFPVPIDIFTAINKFAGNGHFATPPAAGTPRPAAPAAPSIPPRT